MSVRVAHVEGDDLLARGGWGEGVLTANAYLGGGGIAACLRAGAEVVVTGRVTDAALVSGRGPAHFGWRPEDLDRLAGAVVAGHVLECGTQATGGNYSFFGAHDLLRPGFPLAEIAADGSSVITKHPGTGGAVTAGTVTAQLLYETAGARYAGPDVTARLDTVRLAEEGPDRVRIDGVRGEAPPPTLKTGLTRLGGWRNEVTFVLTGLDVDGQGRAGPRPDGGRLRRRGEPPGRGALDAGPHRPGRRRRPGGGERAAAAGGAGRRPGRGGAGGQRRRGRAGAGQLPRLPCHRAAR